MVALIDQVKHLAREAGTLASSYFRSEHLQAQQKSSIYDVVTEADAACERLITAEILRTHPDASIVAEEGGSVVGGGVLTWYVDPIDGTSNFARGIAMWAVSIAVECDGAIIAAAVFDPLADHLFWADEGGAYLDAPGQASKRIRSSGANRPDTATVAMNFPLARDLVHFPDLALEQFATVTREYAQVRMLGSTCITLCWIAAGWLDATVSFGTHAWDVAAAAFIVRQAGGVYEAYAGGERQHPTGDHRFANYYAAVPEGRFDTLTEIMRTQSLRP